MSDTALVPPEIDPWVAEAEYIAQLEAQHRDVGRPSLLADTYRVSKCLKAIADGNYKSVAALSAGFARETLSRIESRAKDGDIAAIAFSHALEKAEACSEVEDVSLVKQAARSGPQYWAAAMTKLERSKPERWGKRLDDSNTPKVVVQIGVQQGDVSVSFASAPPSPQVIDLGSESQSIPSMIRAESDKQDYVNEAKSLTVETLAVPERKRSERQSRPAKGSVRRGKSRGTHPR